VFGVMQPVIARAGFSGAIRETQVHLDGEGRRGIILRGLRDRLDHRDMAVSPVHHDVHHAPEYEVTLLLSGGR